MFATLIHMVALQALVASAPTPAPAALPGARPEHGGFGVRVVTPEGPVRLWVPEGYDPATAATVVYVHGYNRTADGVWAQAELPRQFRESGQNALFVVPDSVQSDRALMRRESLPELERALSRVGVEFPNGPMVAVGHSGAYRTLARWVDDPRLSAIILLDALYGGDAAFARFAAHRQLVLVTRCTRNRAARFLGRIPGALRRAELPGVAHFTAAERAARVVAFETSMGHAELNDRGAAIPVLLELVLPRRPAPAYAQMAYLTSAPP